jgi:putative hemolysin
MLNIKDNKVLFIFIIVIVLVIGGYFFLIAPSNEVIEEKEIPLPPFETLETFEGKLYTTPAGSQFDDYLVTLNGQEYGIEAEIDNETLRDRLIDLRDSGRKIKIEGELITDVPDYGDRQIVVKSLIVLSDQEEEEVNQEEDQTGIANPAAVYCEAEGGILESRETDRGEVTMCVFEDGECEEWAFFRGECTPEKGNIVLEGCEEYADAEICTTEYNPVCARIISGETAQWKTYSNACNACTAQENIIGYLSGACEEKQ